MTSKSVNSPPEPPDRRIRRSVARLEFPPFYRRNGYQYAHGSPAPARWHHPREGVDENRTDRALGRTDRSIRSVEARPQQARVGSTTYGFPKPWSVYPP
jgi:hypothetical protein